jgi:hypothetical protein
MDIPSVLSVLCAVVAFGAGLVAARYGLKASKVEAEPTGPDSPEIGAHSEPYTIEGKLLYWSAAGIQNDQAIREAMAKAGHLNRIVVHWALGASAAGLASAILGVIKGA